MEQQRFIEAIAAAPDDRGPWLVYADWLLERGDPRSELISLSLAIEDGNADPALAERVRRLEQDEPALLSPRLFAQSHHWRFTLWRGFVRRAVIAGRPDEPPPTEAIEALFADPHAALPLDLELVQAPNRRELTAALRAAPRPALRGLVVLDLGPGTAHLPAVAPRLEDLELRMSSWAAEALEGTAVEELAHANLRRLSTHALACPALGGGRVRLPRLESLCFHLDSTDRLLHPGSLLDTPPPRFSVFELYNHGHPFERTVFERLAASPSLPQLRELRLGTLSAEALEELCAHAAAFGHLEVLFLSVIAPSGEGDRLYELVHRSFPRTRLRVYVYPTEMPTEEPW